MDNDKFIDGDIVVDVQSVDRNFFSVRKYALITVSFLLLLSILSYFFFHLLKTPPRNFPINTEITIETGTSLKEVIAIAKNENLIRSEIVMYFTFLLKHKTESIKAGKYLFSEPLELEQLIQELIKGNPKADLVKFTHIEGESVEQIAKKAEVIFKNFNSELFFELTNNLEGKLFPETYLVPNTFTTEEFVDLMSQTFVEKIEPHTDKINNFYLSLDEILTLASIIEREANTSESKKIVSGILQNRLKINMPLQADASIEYVLNKPLSELTPEDLKIDSPFNTYTNTGLPPHPIGNPGLEAILAVLEPQESEYLFYITDDAGNFYYAKNFDEHRINIAKYLR